MNYWVIDKIFNKPLAPRQIEYLAIDREFKIVDTSEEVQRFADSPQEVMLGKDVRDGFPELIGVEDILIDILEGHHEYFEYKGIARFSARSSPLYIDLYIIRDEDEEELGNKLFMFLEDVTEKMVLEQTLVQRTNELELSLSKLAASKKYIDKIIDFLADALFVTNQAGTIKTVNKAAQDLFEYSESELIKQLISSIIPEGDLIFQVVQQYPLSPGELLQDVEVVCITKTGKKISVAFSCSAIETEIEGIQDFIYIGRDITERKQAEEALAKTVSLLQATFDATADGILAVDNQGKINTFNRKYVEMWSIPDEVIASREHSKAIAFIIEQLKEPEKFLQMVRKLYDQPEAETYDLLEFKDGRIFERYCQPQRIGENIVGRVCNFRDITCRVQAEKATERLLLNILPQPIAERLKHEQTTIAESFADVTVMFADIVGFTELSSRISPTELVEILNVIFSEFDQLAEQHDLEKIKTIGDAYMVVGGLPHPQINHAMAIAEMALDMQAAITEYNKDTGHSLNMRIGINTGGVVAGVIGTKKFIYDLWGDTVNIASRMESHGLPGKIQLTEATYQCLRDRYLFEQRGRIPVKGKGEMITYFLTGRI